MTVCLPTIKHFGAYTIPFTMNRSLPDISLELQVKKFYQLVFPLEERK